MLESLVPISLFLMAIIITVIGVLFMYEQYISIISQKEIQKLEAKYREQQIENEARIFVEINTMQQQLKQIIQKLEK